MSGRRILVYGLAITGDAVARAALARGDEPVLADDDPAAAASETARQLGLDVVVRPDDSQLARLVAAVDLVVPAPAVPEHHRVVRAAQEAGVRLTTELDLAWEWEQQRPHGPRPMVAVTGTDGKTSTTLLATDMVTASGRRAVACGNTEIPLVAALDLDVDVFVVECTSFRLAFVSSFRPRAATWLNLAPDHLDWHDSLGSYVAAKARVWAHQQADDVAIGWADDAVVMDHLSRVAARRVTFAATGADYVDDGGVLTGPHGPLVEVGAMARSLPHDITNTLAAAATVLEAGVATVAGVEAAASSFAGVPHRISLVAETGSVRFFDDSKATTPHAAVTAIRSFERVVLVAGGKNKGLDLSELAAEPQRVGAVVAIGQSADDVASAFDGRCPVVKVTTNMDDAVTAARELARPGDVVLLSPGCASFDWYTGYAARGDDFARAVREQLEAR
jgi:UDP-N-acetylmuramoylalanine--D-glutamate ligase